MKNGNPVESLVCRVPARPAADFCRVLGGRGLALAFFLAFGVPFAAAAHIEAGQATGIFTDLHHPWSVFTAGRQAA